VLKILGIENDHSVEVFRERLEKLRKSLGLDEQVFSFYHLK